MNSRESSSSSITPSESISSNTTNHYTSLEAPTPSSTRTATCWNFFHYPADTSVKTVKCYICKKAVTFNKASSSNLTAHAKQHRKLYNQFEEGKSETKRGTIQKQLLARVVPRYDVEKSHEFLVQWIISDSQAFRVGENPFFQKFLASIHFDYKALKKDAVTKRTMELFNVVKLKISDLLANQLQKFSLTLDIWTSPSQDPFLCVTLHFINLDWILKSQVIAFRYIPGKHSGVSIAVVLEEIVKEYEIKERILTVTMDNASNNDKLVDELIAKGIIVDAERHIRCFSHIVNLAAQDCIYEFNDKLQDLRSLVTAIRYSPLKLERLKGKCSSLCIPFLKPILDVKTRWNSTYDMITRALELKQPLSLLMDELCRENADLFSLDNSDWDFFKELTFLLSPFKEVTKRISGQQYATFNNVLPLYNYLMDHCEENRTKYLNWSEGITRSPYRSITNSCDILKDLIKATTAAYAKFDKYYNIQSDYAIAALVLDPRLNVSYYIDENNATSTEQVESAKTEVLHYFNSYYKPDSIGSQDFNQMNPNSESSTGIDRIYKKRKISISGNCEVTIYSTFR